jgi:hypothetical protein
VIIGLDRAAVSRAQRSAAIATDRASLGSVLLVFPETSSRTREPSLGRSSPPLRKRLHAPPTRTKTVADMPNSGPLGDARASLGPRHGKDPTGRHLDIKGLITDEDVAFDRDTATGMMPVAHRVAGVLAFPRS